MFREAVSAFLLKMESSLNYNLIYLCTFVDRVIECIFIEITLPSGNKSTIGSIYRPGTKHPLFSTSEQFSQFCELLSNLCNELSSSTTNNFIAGHLNLDVSCITVQ
jgi:hypothetical protein